MFTNKNYPFPSIIIIISLITLFFTFSCTSINFYHYLYNSIYLVVTIGILLTMISLLSSQKRNSVLLILYLMFITYITLLNREPHARILRFDLARAVYQVINSLVVRKESLYNILLFVPLGSMLYKLYPSRRTYILPFLISAIIEISQFVFKIGWCEIIDFLSNGFGGIIGILICSSYRKLNTSKNE